MEILPERNGSPRKQTFTRTKRASKEGQEHATVGATSGRQLSVPDPAQALLSAR